MIDFDSGCKNKYVSLYSALRGEILHGKIKAGEKLPSKRALAAELGISVETVRLAYEQLLAEGYIRSVERSGYYAEKVNIITSVLKSSAAERSEAADGERFEIDFVKGSTPVNMFPFSTWARLMRGVILNCGEHLLERVPVEGDSELRRAVSEYLYRSRGIDADPAHIIIGAGAEHLYGVLVQLLGRNKKFAVENPGYPRIAETYALNGAEIVPVSVKEAGICLDEAMGSGADIIHVSPSHQFPTGAVMPVYARSELIAYARAKDKYIIEDDYDSEFRLFGKPLQSMYSLCPDRTVYMNTFSKSLAPSMRMGYMVLPPVLYDKFKKLFASMANTVPLFEQKTLAEMLNGGYFERHISKLKNHYRGIRAQLLDKLNSFDGCEVTDTGGGLHIIAKFPHMKSDQEIKERARSAGINLKCLSDYLVAPMEGTQLCAVINYSGISNEQLEKFCGF